MTMNTIMTRTVILLSLLVCIRPAPADASTAHTGSEEQGAQTTPRFPCSPFGIAVSVQHIFAAVASGHPALAVDRVLGPAHSDSLFDQYQFGAYGDSIPASAPINQI